MGKKKKIVDLIYFKIHAKSKNVNLEPAKFPLLIKKSKVSWIGSKFHTLVHLVVYRGADSVS